MEPIFSPVMGPFYTLPTFGGGVRQLCANLCQGWTGS